MATYAVKAWNVYSAKPENSRLVSGHSVEAGSVTEALDQGQTIAANWNREETRENMTVSLITCEGFIRSV